MRLLEHLRSKRLAVTFIILIALSLALATIIPQKTRMSETELTRLRSDYPVFAKVINLAGLDDVYSSWWFLFIITLFFANVALNLPGRIAISARQYRISELLSPEQVTRLPMQAETPSAAVLDEETKRRVRDAVAAAGYRVTDHSKGISAAKARIGLWAVPLFHGSLLVILLGILGSGLGKFSGSFEIAEGQVLRGKPDEFLSQSRGLLRRQPELAFSVTLRSFQAEYWDREHPRLYRSVLEIADNGMPLASRAIEMNEPLTHRGFSFYQSKYHGYSARFTVTDREAGRDISGYVNFPFQERGKAIMSQDFHIPMAGYRAELRYAPAYPDMLVASIFDGRDTAWEGILPKGGRIDLGRFVLVFSGMVQWTGLHVASDPGVPVVYAGFGLLVLSVLSIVFVVPRRIWILYEDNMIIAGARAVRESEAVKDEFRRVQATIREELSS